jgi:hypothetical protein
VLTTRETAPFDGGRDTIEMTPGTGPVVAAGTVVVAEATADDDTFPV